MQSKTNLGVYLHDCFKSNGLETWATTDSIHFIEKLGLASKITLAVAVRETTHNPPQHATIISEKSNIEVVPLPGWDSMINTILTMPKHVLKIIRIAKKISSRSNLIWLRTPSLVAPFFYYFAKKSNTPVILHISGNILTSFKHGKYKGFLRFLANLVAVSVHLITKWMARDSLTFTTGGELKLIFSTPTKSAYSLDDIRIERKNVVIKKRKAKKFKSLLFVGRLAYGKGLDTLLYTFQKVSRIQPGLILKIAGTGKLLEPLKKLAEKLKIYDRVEFSGFISPHGLLQRLYRQCDALILPTDSSEGFPRVILEAWANGIPVITTNVGGIPYRITDGYNGLLVNPNDSSGMSEAILRLAKDKELNSRLIEGGYQTVIHLTFENQRANLVKLLNEKYPHLGNSLPV